MRRTLGNHDCRPGAAAQFLARDTTAQRSGDDLEALLLQRVDMLGGDEGPRLEVSVHLKQFAVCVACGLANYQFFSRHGMFEYVACFHHLSASFPAVR